MEIDEIIKNIFEKQEEILSNLNFEDVDVYLFLKNECAKGDILNNFIFQFVFKSYYGLNNAGLSDKIKDCFFQLLSDKQSNLKIILSKLYEIPTSQNHKAIQFAFATKLLHTINNDLPIFDSKVGEIFHMQVTGVDKIARIRSCEEIYGSLKDSYDILKREEKIKKVILKFRRKFNVNDGKMSDTKILDFIIWSLGKLEQKK